MSRHNSLPAYQLLQGNLQLTLTSEVTHIGFLDNIGIQTDLEGTDAAGAIRAQVSANYARDAVSGVVTNPGTWVTLLSQAITAGEPANTYMDLNQLSAPWIRLIWEPSTQLTQDIFTVADDAGSLNDTYFYIYTATDTFVVWIDVDGGGTDPAIPDTTSVQVAISEDDTADDVATAVAAALDALATDFNASATTNQVSVENVDTGATQSAVDGAVPTGFTFAIATEDIITSVITGKQL